MEIPSPIIGKNISTQLTPKQGIMELQVYPNSGSMYTNKIPSKDMKKTIPDKQDKIIPP